MLSTFWKTLKWMVLILLVLVGAAGGAAVYFWNHSDELLRTKMLAAIQEFAPDSKADVRRVRVDLLGRVHLDDFSWTLPGETTPFLILPSTEIDIDRDAFIERQEVIIRSVELLKPRVALSREADGSWNWQKLPKFPEGSKGALPECRIQDAVVVLKLAQAETATVGTLALSDVDLTLKPDSKRSFELAGKVDVERIGQLKVAGKVNIDTQTGAVKGSLNGLHVGRELLDYVATFEPRAAQTVAQLESKLREEFLKEPDPKNGSPFSIQGLARQDRARRGAKVATNVTTPIVVPAAAIASATTPPPKAISHGILAEAIGVEASVLGLLADLNLSFEIARLQPGSTPEVTLVCDVVQGEITNTALAFPLQELTGQIEITPDKVTIRKLTASNGPTEVEIRGEVSRGANGPVGRVGMKMSNIACDQRLRDRLSFSFGKIYDAHHPRGFLDMQAIVSTNAEGQWKPESFTVSANKCSVTHDVFPYPIEDAIGSIKQVGQGDLIIDMRGYAGRQPISLKGRVRDPGPAAWITFDIDVANLPIDEKFLNACPPSLQKTVAAMNLKGLVDGHWHLEKPPGEGQPFKPDLEGFLHDGSMIYDVFRYRVDALGGKLGFDGTTWTFTDLKGVHGGAQLVANGAYTKPKGESGDLRLTVVTQDAAMDSSLFEAVPQSLKNTWKEFQLRGTIKKVVTEVHWPEGQPVVISLPQIEITRGRCLISRFPYEITDIEASYSYIPKALLPRQAAGSSNVLSVLKIKSFEGRHDGSLLVVNPNGGLVTMFENGDWKVRLDNFSARDLKPNNDLKRAVTTGLKSVLATFDPDRGLDVNGLLELWGTSDPRFPMTAAWSIDTELSGSTVSAGLTFDDVHGHILSRGKWDGANAEVDGSIDLASLKVFEKYELNEIRGPFQLRDGELVFGSRTAVNGLSPDQVIDPLDQISAKFVQGLLTLNSVVSVEKQSDYHVRVNLSHGKLETFAARYMKEPAQLRGTMHGWLNLMGQGADIDSLAGTGQLQISPAALYQLPVVLRVLDVLLPQAAKTSAFNYALCNFRMQRSSFLFDAIDLVGDQFQLRGQGTASFDGDLNLRFYSMLPYSMVPKGQSKFWMPIVSDVGNLVRLVTQEATKGWVVVEVTGKTDDPETNIVPAAKFDDAIKGILNSLRPLPLAPQPLRAGPPLSRAPTGSQLR